MEEIHEMPLMAAAKEEIQPRGAVKSSEERIPGYRAEHGNRGLHGRRLSPQYQRRGELSTAALIPTYHVLIGGCGAPPMHTCQKLKGEANEAISTTTSTCLLIVRRRMQGRTGERVKRNGQPAEMRRL